MKDTYLSDKVHKALYGAGDYAISDKRKNVFARAYIARLKDWDAPEWTTIYKDWLLSGGDDIGLDKLRAYALYNYKPSKKDAVFKDGVYER